MSPEEYARRGPRFDKSGCEIRETIEMSPEEFHKAAAAAAAPTPGSEILTRAAALIAGDRAAQHGPKERNHQNIADHWNAYLAGRLDRPLTALDVALMMVELKIARTKAGAGLTNFDNYLDMAGYAGVAGEIALNGREVMQKCDPAVLVEVSRALGEGGSFMAPAGASPLK